MKGEQIKGMRWAKHITYMWELKNSKF